MENIEYIRILMILEAVGHSLSTYWGAKRSHDLYELSYRTVGMKATITPAKIIRSYFGLSKSKITLLTYIQYISAYIIFIRIFIVAAFVLFFEIKLCLFLYVLLLVVIITCSIPDFIWFCIAQHKIDKREKQIIKEHNRNKPKTKLGIKDIINLVKNEFYSTIESGKIWKSAHQICRDSKWKHPLQQQLERCVRTYKGTKYIPEENISYIETRILPDYKKHINCEITENEQGERFFVIMNKKSKQPIFQMIVKND